MSAVSGGGGNYISDGEIMAWLAEQQGRIYGDLKESMDMSKQRADFADKLTDIKAHLQEANSSHNFGKVDEELQNFMQTYGSDPEFADACRSLGEVATKIHDDWQYATKGYAKAVTQYKKDLEIEKLTDDPGTRHYYRGGGVVVSSSLKPPTEPTKSYDPTDIKGWQDLIDGKLDGSSKNDQLTMIHIQELKATLDQGAQLGSTFISSGDKTSSAIINNIA